MVEDHDYIPRNGEAPRQTTETGLDISTISARDMKQLRRDISMISNIRRISRTPTDETESDRI